jgi:hypothetical protein
MTPEEVVDLQLAAYNAKDIDAFLATYAEDAQTFNLGTEKPTLSGRAQFREAFGSKTFKLPDLKAEILSRFVCGNKVVDLERSWGFGPQPITGPVIYEVNGDVIQNVWFADANTVQPPKGDA